MRDLNPDEKVRLRLEKNLAYDAQSRAVRDRLFKNAPQLATIGADGRIQALSGDDAPAEFMPNLYYGQAEIIDYTPVQGGIGKAMSKSFISIPATPEPTPIYPIGSYTQVIFYVDAAVISIDGFLRQSSSSIANSLAGGAVAVYYIDNNDLSIGLPFGESSYNGILDTFAFPSGDVTGHIYFSYAQPYIKWGVDIGCNDGWVIAAQCDYIQIQGALIRENQTYEIQGFAALGGGELVAFSPIYTAIADTPYPNSSVSFERFDFGGYVGDATRRCAGQGITTLEWTYKWRRQGRDWFEL